MKKVCIHRFRYMHVWLQISVSLQIMIPALSHTFVNIEHAIISTAILLPSADLRKVVVSYITSKSMCMTYWSTSSFSRKKVWLPGW